MDWPRDEYEFQAEFQSEHQPRHELILNTVTEATIIEVPAHENILQYSVGLLFEKFNSASPDFSNVYVLLPHAQVAPHFNKALLQHTRNNAFSTDTSAIIPPWTGTLKTWAKQFAANSHPENQIIGEYARQLLFIEAIQQHPALFKEENKWQITQALLNLFEELSLNQKNIFTSAEAWQEQLQKAYGIEHQHQHLLYESNLVYTLWHAWQQQLEENNLYDDIGDYISRLNNTSDVIDDKYQFICIGFANYTKTEQDFIQNLANKNPCHIIDYKNTVSENDIDANDHAFASFISETYKRSTRSIKHRAINYAKYFVDTPPFSIYLAKNEEEQVRAIDYHIRLSILDGKNTIAIISEDRKLSRRLRALVERSNIQLKDNAGWSLATTQAATIIERWLECIEEDFNAFPLLDCLKSPYLQITQATLGAEATDEDFTKNIYRFEHDLVFHENVSGNISKFKEQLNRRLNRLSHWPKNAYDDLIGTLNFIDKTASPLVRLYSNNSKIKLSEFISTLTTSLDQLGVLLRYQDDDAGKVLLNTLEEIKQSIQHSDPILSWYDCRLWLGMALESQHFTPLTNNANVQLMTLEQSSYLQFDSIIFAATESQHFPGSPNASPFFNQAVRASLELNTWEEQYQQRHELFNRALLSAPEILFTACAEDKGEEKPVSPWLELLINFHQLAYGNAPENYKLRHLVQSQSEAFNCDVTDVPEPAKRPEPDIPEDLIPERLSASSYQRIINCPYQYFSADALNLKALEELSDELKKADYGERIHLILQVFHNGDKRHGDAFKSVITNANKSQAESYLTTLSEKIFLTDLENNVLHKSWLFRWKKHIPAYINWQIKHQSDWNIYLSEKNIEVSLDETDQHAVKIYGRLDRIDKRISNEKGFVAHAIIDYKTGRTARQEDVDSGENVQLSTYALLDAEADEVSYLSVDSSDQKVESKSFLSGDDLQTNRDENRQRIITLFKQMKSHQPLHAWGDINVCSYCNFSGLCRKATWSEN